nr:geraniol 8-hydroxylase-like [Tanacetum cinerariifolium]
MRKGRVSGTMDAHHLDFKQVQTILQWKKRWQRKLGCSLKDTSVHIQNLQSGCEEKGMLLYNSAVVTAMQCHGEFAGLFSIPLPVRLALVLKGNGVDVTKHCVPAVPAKRMPPGPTGLPIIGNLLDLGPKPHESLAKLSKKHGPLMTIRLVLWIPTNDEWRTIRKALNTCLTHQHKLDSLRNLREKVVHGMLEFLRECMRKHEPVDIGKLAFAVALNQMSNTCLSQNVTTYE